MIPTLNAGWGLDFVWPFLLDFPHDKVAVVDAICFAHTGSAEKTGPLYHTERPLTGQVFSCSMDATFQ